MWNVTIIRGSTFGVSSCHVKSDPAPGRSLKTAINETGALHLFAIHRHGQILPADTCPTTHLFQGPGATMLRYSVKCSNKILFRAIKNTVHALTQYLAIYPLMPLTKHKLIADDQPPSDHSSRTQT